MAGGLDPPAAGRWPRTRPGRADPAVLSDVADALMGIRGAKSTAKVSMRAPLSRVEVSGPAGPWWTPPPSAADDLRRTGHVQGDLVFTPRTDATEISVAAELAEVPAALTELPACASRLTRHTPPGGQS